MKPEQYWIERGEDVIGRDVLADHNDARQATTYQAIASWIVGHGVTWLLDVGCNVAALSLFLKDAGFNLIGYVGVDSNPFAANAARVYGFVIPGNLRKLDFADRHFQVVVVKDVIEHLESYTLLAEAFRVASQYVIVATYLPWDESEPARIEYEGGKYFANRYKLKDVADFARTCGFTLYEMMTTREKDGNPNMITYWKREA